MRKAMQNFLAAYTLVMVLGGFVLAGMYIWFLVEDTEAANAVSERMARQASEEVREYVLRNWQKEFDIQPQVSAVEADFVEPVMTKNPARLMIPKLGVDSYIQKVGVTSAGNMGTPQGERKYQDVAWYKNGATPGEVGSAVIAGHLDNGYGRSAVFFELNALAIGDSIFVKNEQGKILEFRVVEKQIYPAHLAPRDKVFGRQDRARLNLITCDGVWSEEARSYSERMVVYTELVSA